MVAGILPNTVIMHSVRDFLGLPEDGPTGQGVAVGVVDSGIDAEHPDLDGAVELWRSRDCIYNGADTDDRYYHGTLVAGLIAGRGRLLAGRYQGIAPRARLIAYKVCEDVDVDEFAIKDAIHAAINAGVDILTLALTLSPADPLSGAPPATTPPWVYASNSRIQRELERAAHEGVLCIVAAGNDGMHGYGTVNIPAGTPYVVAVGACDLSGEICELSSRGPYWVDEELKANGFRSWRGISDCARSPQTKPDLVAPGYEVWGPLTTQNPDLIAEAALDPRSAGGRYIGETGTSPAAAVVSGLAACAIDWVRRGPRNLEPGAVGSLTLRRMLREAAAQDPVADIRDGGYGRLRWSALSAVIERFWKDEAYATWLTRPQRNGPRP